MLDIFVSASAKLGVRQMLSTPCARGTQGNAVMCEQSEAWSQRQRLHRVRCTAAWGEVHCCRRALVTC